MDAQRLGGVCLPPVPPFALTPIGEHLPLTIMCHDAPPAIVVTPTGSAPTDLIPRHAHFCCIPLTTPELHTSDKYATHRGA